MRTAELHLALASDPANPAFAPEPLRHHAPAVAVRLAARAAVAARSTCCAASSARSARAARRSPSAILAREGELDRLLDAHHPPPHRRDPHAHPRRLPPRPGAVDRRRLRDHRLRGRARPAAVERRFKRNAAARRRRHAALAAVRERRRRCATAATAPRTCALLTAWARAWTQWTSASFLGGYLDRAADTHDPAAERRRARDCCSHFFLLEKVRLRARLRAQQPPRLGRDPAARAARAAAMTTLRRLISIAGGAHVRACGRRARPRSSVIGDVEPLAAGAARQQRRHLGGHRGRRHPRRALQVRHPRTASRCSTRPIHGAAPGGAARHGLDRSGRSTTRGATPRGCAARGARSGPAAPVLDLRGPPRVVDARARGRQPLADLPRARARARRARHAPRLHPRRADAGDRAPVLRLVGLRDDRLLRADRRATARPRI